MSLAILFHLLCAQHVSDINISIFVLQVEALVLQPAKRTPPNISRRKKLQHTTKWEQDDRCGNSSTQSQAPEDGYINVQNMLSA